MAVVFLIVLSFIEGGGALLLWFLGSRMDVRAAAMGILYALGACAIASVRVPRTPLERLVDLDAPKVPTFGKDGVTNFQSSEKSSLSRFSREAVRRRVKKFIRIELPVAVAITMVIRTFLLQSFVAGSDAAAPEVPRGSKLLVWKINRSFSPGDLVCYRQKDIFVLGRVVRSEPGGLVVASNVAPEIPVQRNAVVGRVASIYWRAPASTSQGTADVAGQPVSRSWHPEPAHSGNERGTVFVTHDNVDVIYALYHAGQFGTGADETFNPKLRSWHSKGVITLNNGRKFLYLRVQDSPETLRLNGDEFDLTKGRVIVLYDDGRAEQRPLFPPLAVARQPAALAKLVAASDHPPVIEGEAK